MLSAEAIKERLSVEDIVKLCCQLQGTEDCLWDRQGHPIFNTVLCHNGDSDKLYYYPETGLFHCYTCGKSSDIFELVSGFKQIKFKEALIFICQFFNIRDTGFGNDSPEELTSDWDIFQRVKDYESGKREEEPPRLIPENLLEFYYPLAAPLEWQKEGISPAAMRAYGIRVDSALHHIIIPHRDPDGKLIGIRRRSFNPIEVEAGKKYMPAIIQGEIFRHSLGKNLFGLYENKETIQRLKKVCVFEAEKSVMQVATMFGIENCFAVAVCGNKLSEDQIRLLLNLGVIEITIAFDREFEGGRGAPDTVQYEEQILKTVTPFLPYVNVNVIMDYDHLLPQKKMSPSDAGKEIFEKLYHARIPLAMPHPANTKPKRK